MRYSLSGWSQYLIYCPFSQRHWPGAEASSARAGGGEREVPRVVCTCKARVWESGKEEQDQRDTKDSSHWSEKLFYWILRGGLYNMRLLCCCCAADEKNAPPPVGFSIRSAVSTATRVFHPRSPGCCCHGLFGFYGCTNKELGTAADFEVGERVVEEPSKNDSH